mgnify:CR=1 FL=1
MVAGFGSGKTEAAVKRAIIGKIKYPESNRGFYAPTYDLIRMIAFPRFEAALDEMGISYRLYKSPLNYLEVIGYGKIFFRSMDAPHRIIGYEHADADVDELDTMKPEDAAYAWRQILARNRQNKSDGSLNTIGCTTTPEGFKFVYDTWKKAPAPGYEIIHAPTSSNPHIPESYIETLKNSYPPHLLNAYLEGQFVNLNSGSVYPDFDRALNSTNMTVIKADKILSEKAGTDKKAALHIGMDFNINKMSAIVHVIIDNIPYAVNEFMGLRDTPQMIEAIKDAYPDRRILIYPDASGSNGNTRNAGETDISLLEAEFIVQAHKANPPIKDRVNSVNAMILNANDVRRYKVNIDLCPLTVDALEQQVWGKDGKPDKTHDKDHPADALGYFIYYRYPINGVASGTSQVRM